MNNRPPQSEFSHNPEAELVTSDQARTIYDRISIGTNPSFDPAAQTEILAYGPFRDGPKDTRILLTEPGVGVMEISAFGAPDAPPSELAPQMRVKILLAETHGTGQPRTEGEVAKAELTLFGNLGIPDPDQPGVSVENTLTYRIIKNGDYYTVVRTADVDNVDARAVEFAMGKNYADATAVSRERVMNEDVPVSSKEAVALAAILDLPYDEHG